MGAQKLVYALFCEHHSTDASGKNTYTSVFDEQNIAVRAIPGAPRPQLPFPKPQPTGAFVLALRLDCAPNTQSCWVQVKDMHGQVIVPRVSLKLAQHPKGAHRLNVHFQNGIPVVDQGTYVFEVGVGETLIGAVELPVNIKIV